MSGRDEQPERRPGAKGENAVISRGSPGFDPGGAMAHLEPNGVAEMQPSLDGEPAGPTPLSVALRRKWFILGVFVLASAVTVPCIWLFVTPMYEATALVRVAPNVKVIAFSIPENTDVPRLYPIFVNTQVAIIKSATVLDRVLDREKVRRTNWGQEKVHPLLGDPPTLLERLKDCLEVKHVKNTELVEVSMAALDPRSAAVIVNAVVEEYKKDSDEKIHKEDIRRLDYLQRQLTEVEQDISRLREHMHNEAKRLEIDDPQDYRSRLIARLDTLESKREDSERALDIARLELSLLAPTEEAGQGVGEGGSSDVEAYRRYAHDGDWATLSNTRKDLKLELELARLQYGESHHRIQRLLAELKDVEQRLKERELQLDEQWAQGGGGFVTSPGESTPEMRRAFLELDVQKLEREIEQLTKDMEETKDKFLQIADIAKTFSDYEEELTRNRELYGKFQSRRTALETEGTAAGRISIASLANVPTQPSRDRRLKLTAVCLGGALMLGWALAYVRTSTDQRIREARDVQGSVHVPFLGQLPSLPTETDLLAECSPLLIETTRMVRTALLRRLSGTDKRVVLITSSSSQSGKTSVAVLLAKSLALLGKKVLLVEADLRRPSLSGRLNLESKSGLAASLAGAANDEQAILPTSVSGFDVLMAGEYPPGFDAELLANGVLASCLRRWKSRYDFVLLDSPPVLPVADARILAGQADGTIMVLRASHSRRPEVVQAYADLSAAGGTLLGTILVGVRGGSGPGYYYGDYEPYGREPRALTA
ncbi:MAG: polysaccharide biosynthesis tyrosine autokinase [Phycisphaerales bacterium]|nr:MAG: polysaccharide biosynthesis tyrosine autokinase [Phycisphaerales bacterium]